MGPTIYATDSGFGAFRAAFPTPTKSTYGSSGNGSGNNRESRGRPSLGSMAKRWIPTPVKSDAKCSGARTNLPNRAHKGLTLTNWVFRVDEQGEYLEHTQPGRLNPQFSEWLMGWPLAASALEPLATGKCQSWLQQQRACLRAVFERRRKVNG